MVDTNNTSPAPMPPRDREALDGSAARRLPAWVAYVLAVALPLATLLLRLALGFKAGDAPIQIVFTFPIILCAYFGGLGPGLVATALGMLLSNYALLPPYFGFSFTTGHNLLQSGSLLAAGTLISALSEALHRTGRRAEASRRRQAVTLASIGDAVLTTDAQGRVTFLNAEAERLTGWTNTEALGLPLTTVFRIINEETRAPVEDPVAKVLSSGQVVGLANHTLLLARDGRETPIDDSAAPIREKGRAIEGVVLVFRDVSAHKQGEQALRQSEARFATAFRASPAAIALSRARDSRFVDVNESFLRLLGFAREELIEHTAFALNIFPFPEEIVEVRRAVREQGTVHDREVTIQTKQGELRQVLFSAEVLEIDGEACFLTILYDITDRKQAEQELKIQQETLREQAELLDHAHVLIRDLDSKIVYWNTGAEQLYGWTKAEALGQVTHTFLQTQFPVSLEDCQAQLFGQGSWEGELQHIRRDGSVVYVVSHQVLHRDHAGEPIAILEVNNDITARKQAEQALARSAARMQMLADASRAFAETGVDEQALLEQLARITAEHLQAVCTVRLLADDGQRLDLVAVGHYDHDKALDVQATLGSWPIHLDDRVPAAIAVRTGQPQFMPVTDREALRATMPPERRGMLNRFSPHSVLVTPMQLGGRSVGSLMLARGASEQPAFDMDDLSLAQDLTDRAALAISNVRLLRQVQHELAERTRAEAEVRQREHKLSTLLDLLPVGISILDAERKISYTNPALKHIVALSDAALEKHIYAQRTYLDGAGNPMPPHAFASARAFAEHRPIHHVETGIAKEDGSVIWTDVSAVPVDFPDWNVVVVTSDITARKLAEQALQASELRRELALQAGQLGTWEWNPATHTNALDATSMRLFGFTAETFTGHEDQLFAGIHPDDLPNTLAALQAGMEQGASYDQEFRWQMPDGSIRWLHGTGRASYAADGTASGFYGITADVTARKSAELALQHSNQRLQLLADASRAFAEASADYKQLLDHIARIVGDNLDCSCIVRLISDDGQWLDLSAMYDSDAAKLKDAQAVVAGMRVHMDDVNPIVAVVRSGRPMLIPKIDQEAIRASMSEEMWSVFRLYSPRSVINTPLQVQGRAIGCLVFSRFEPEQPAFTADDLILAQDLAERAALAIANARLLQQVQRSADRLQHLHALDQAILTEHPLTEIAETAVKHIGHLIPAIRVGALLYDADSQMMTLLALQAYGAMQTPPAAQLPLAVFGAAAEALLQGHVYRVADIAALPELPAFIRIGRAEGLRSYFHMPILAEGRLIALLNVGADEPNAFTPEHIEIAREVADQLSIAIQQARLRQQIAQHAQELERRVNARTAELTAANKELEAFSYSVSHDLRAPLRAIDGFSRILLEEYTASMPDEAQRYFQLVRGGAQQMGRLIDDLLAFARLSRQPLHMREVDVAALVRQCLGELHDEQDGRSIELAIGDLPACQGDSGLLKQVWFNLIANALKYTRRRDPARIEIGSRVENGETIYFVKDNGTGFDMRYADKLFGVFQRLHRAEDYEGTGVGLAIVQRIVHRHGGRVWAEAAIEEGATFSIVLKGGHE